MLVPPLSLSLRPRLARSLCRYHTIDEAIERANSTEYGLASVVIGKNIDQCLTVAHGMRAGVCWVNTYGALSVQAPFGGYKMVGGGSVGGGVTNRIILHVVTIVGGATIISCNCGAV